MAYQLKYRIEFQDKHSTESARAQWRIDILADQPAPPDSVVLLMPADNPLVLEYTNSDENKTSWIVGRKATISYVFNGAAGEPDVDVFFDTDERYHKVEIYKNETIDGVYYVKPDAGQYPYAHTPHVNTITAVDGLAFAKGTPIVARESGSLIYHTEPLNTFLTRILYQVVDPTTQINAVNSMVPTGLVAGHNIWSDVKVHTDMFFDFVDGAKSVYDCLEMFCKTFYARLYSAKGQLWFVRTSDLFDEVLPVAIGSGAEISIPDYLRTINPDTLPAVDNDPNCGIQPALKQATFTAHYKSINQLVNFDWALFTPGPGGGFDDWPKRGSTGGSAVVVDRVVDDSQLEDAYVARISFGIPEDGISQFTNNTGQGPYDAGDILEVSFKYRFWNTKKFRIQIVLNGATSYWLDSSGNWTEQIGNADWITITRSGKKQDGSFTLKSMPMPSAGPPYDVWFVIEVPTERSYHTPPEDGDIRDSTLIADCMDIYPVKIGVIGFDALGRGSKIINKALYSKVQPDVEFNFLDTGETRLSNTLFLDTAAIDGWTSTKPGLPTQDIERKMAQSHIDEYAKSVRTFEGTIYSNITEFYNIFAVSGMEGRKFLLLRDKYNVMYCKHDILLEEVLPENAADTYYTEHDLDES